MCVFVCVCVCKVIAYRKKARPLFGFFLLNPLNKCVCTTGWALFFLLLHLHNLKSFSKSSLGMKIFINIDPLNSENLRSSLNLSSKGRMYITGEGVYVLH